MVDWAISTRIDMVLLALMSNRTAVAPVISTE
jgi:hypothetical protein